MHYAERFVNVLLWLIYVVLIGVVPLGAAFVIGSFNSTAVTAGQILGRGALLYLCLAVAGEAAGDLLTYPKSILPNTIANRAFKGCVGGGCIVAVIGACFGIVAIPQSPTMAEQANIIAYSLIISGLTSGAGLLSKWKES